MASKRTGLKLGAFLQATGHHIAAWRHRDAEANAGHDLKHYIRLARAAEDARFDLVFLADSNGIRDPSPNSVKRYGRAATFEPLTLLSSLAAVTTRLGLVATASSTYNEPYNLARAFASLDQISQGRAAWNLVTSSSESEAHNFNLESHPLHAERYERAAEFAAVVKGLWHSYEDDAFLRDKDSGIFVDPAKVHVLHHKGKHFTVRGPLNVGRSPQGHPVIVQAGASEDGKELAAATAEVIFAAQQTLADAQGFYADVKGRMARYGRDPDHLKIMPGIFPVVAPTESEARAKFDYYQSLIHPEIGLAQLQTVLGGFDLSGYPLDGPLPPLPETNGPKSRRELMIDLARRENLTIRDLYLRIAGARGHWQVVGTPAQIVDEMEERFQNGAADGFNVMPPHLPGGLDDFIALVVPELRRRGLFRTEYEGRTLRENLGLPYPAHRPRRSVAQAAE